MENVIKITKCDNQLTIVAVSSDQKTVYQLVQAGGGSAVEVINVALEEGEYVLPRPILNKSEDTVVKLPADTYTIYYTGLNLGGDYNFEFTLNGPEPYKLSNGQGAAKYGYIWNHGGPQPSTILVKIG